MQIKIEGIEIQTIIGCYAHERHEAQELVINLELFLYEQDWLATDQLDNTINYDAVIDYVTTCVAQTKFQLLESLAQYLSQMLLNQYPALERLQIELVKPAICGVRAGEIKAIHQCCRQFQVCLALGSNTGNLPKQQLITAIEMLGEHISDTQVGKCYRTLPVGFLDQNEFYNTALIGHTSLLPQQLLAKIKFIEKLMGKTEICINGPRVIDIDIIFFADWVRQYHFLTIPHPRMHLRDFVLQPLVDIAPDFKHPELNLSVKKLLNNLPQENRAILEIVPWS